MKIRDLVRNPSKNAQDRISSEINTEDIKKYFGIQIMRIEESINRWPLEYERLLRDSIEINQSKMLEGNFPPEVAAYFKEPFRAIVLPVVLSGVCKMLLQNIPLPERATYLEKYSVIEKYMSSFERNLSPSINYHFILCERLIDYLEHLIPRYQQDFKSSNGSPFWWNPDFGGMASDVFIDIVTYTDQLAVLFDNPRFREILKDRFNNQLMEKLNVLFSLEMKDRILVGYRAYFLPIVLARVEALQNS